VANLKIAVTGRPGIGKTTLCMKVFNALKSEVEVAGFITQEVRESGRRIGFKIIDLQNGEEEWLAKVGEGRVKIGKYSVFVDAVDRISGRIEKIALDKNVDVLIIDEVGPMELRSRRFVEVINRLVGNELEEAQKSLLFTIHYRSRHWLLEKIRKNFRLYNIDERNRNQVAEEIVDTYRRILKL
jgi:nucleoside-triphosphatase